MRLRALQTVDWRLVVDRNERILFRSLTSITDRFPRVAGLRWVPRYELRAGPVLYHSERELEALRDLWRRGGVPLFVRFRKKLLFQLRSYLRLGRRIERMDVSRLPKRALWKLLDGYIEAALNAHAFLLPVPVADRILSNMIAEQLPTTSEAQKQQWLAALAFPSKENEHVREERSFYRLAGLHLRHSPLFPSALKQHLRAFGWIGARGMWWEHAWTESDVRERIRFFVQERKHPSVAAHQLNAVRHEREHTTRKLIERYGLQGIRREIRLAKEFAYLRTFRTDAVYRVAYQVRELFYEIARRAHVDPSEIVNFTIPEVRQTLAHSRSAVTTEALRRRHEYFATVRYGRTYEIVAGRRWKSRIGRVLKVRVRTATVVHGQPAYPGRVRGRVRIVLSVADLPKVKRGDILVGVMTFPNYVPAMERAAAFVTDEGGILCHAAIVSRELRKPCVIATKVATRVLKDGDRVEVDATKGIVRKV